MNTQRTKVFAYLRVSYRSQVSGDGFKRQEHAIRSYCKLHKLDLIKVFREDASGTEHNRPVLAEMMVHLEKNGHDVNSVIIEKLDRLARDLMVQEAILDDFSKMDVKVISTMEGNF